MEKTAEPAPKPVKPAPPPRIVPPVPTLAEEAAEPLAYPPGVKMPYVPRGWTPERMSEYATMMAARLAGGESLKKVVATAKPKMDMHTVFKWLAADPAFRRLYKLAREAQAEGYADEIVTLSDESVGAKDNAEIQAYRLRVDSRKWVCSKLLAKVYGDRVGVEHTGSLSIAGISAGLKQVKPVTFDENGNEIEDAEIVPPALEDLL